MNGTVQISHGDFFCSHQLSQKMTASAQSETYKASISTSRPFSMIPALISHISAATSDPRGPRLWQATVTNAIVTSRTQRIDGARAVHSFCRPKILNEPAASQLIRGGLRK